MDAPSAGGPQPNGSPEVDPQAVLAIWTMDLATRLVCGNEALATLFGLPAGPVDDVPLLHFIGAIHRSDVLEVVRAIEASIVARERYEIVYRVCGRDGERLVLARGRVERDPDGTPRRHLGELRELRSITTR